MYKKIIILINVGFVVCGFVESGATGIETHTKYKKRRGRERRESKASQRSHQTLKQKNKNKKRIKHL